MKTLGEQIAENLKPLKADLAGYQFNYSVMSDCIIIEIVEQNSVYNSFTPISSKIFVNDSQTEIYVRLLQMTEIDLNRVKEIFTKVEEILRKV